jgi:hypothetical protein
MGNHVGMISLFKWKKGPILAWKGQQDRRNLLMYFDRALFLSGFYHGKKVPVGLTHTTHQHDKVDEGDDDDDSGSEL